VTETVGQGFVFFLWTHFDNRGDLFSRYSKQKTERCC